MNTDTKKLRANYDLLAPRERFAAIVAAAVRGDNEERQVLQDTTPMLGYNIPDTFGLTEGFRMAKAFYLIQQLHYAALMFLLCIMDVDEKIDGLDEAMLTTANKYCGYSEAWQRLCSEYGIDSAAMMEENPFLDVLTVAGCFAAKISEGDPDGVDDALEAMRETVKHEAKQWGAV